MLKLRIRDRSFIRGGCPGANGERVIPFCVPENEGLHKILQPFLSGHVFLCITFSYLQKKTALKAPTTSQIYYQNDGRSPIFACVFATREKANEELAALPLNHLPKKSRQLYGLAPKDMCC